MLITSLGLGEYVCYLNLCGDIVKRDNPVTNRAACEVGIHTNVLGQLMLDRIGSNLKCASAVTVKRGGRGDQA